MSKYDTCDVPRPVLKLVRVGHRLWHLRRKSGTPVHEIQAIDEALEVVWRLKRELKQEIAAKKSESWRLWKEQLKAKYIP